MNEVEAYIRQYAASIGIDPDIAVRVAKSEGGLNNPFRRGEGPAPRSQAKHLGATENSVGPFQLYISGTGAGLGDRAIAAGVDPSKDWKAGVNFALDEVKRAGWGQWYGAKNQGITGMMGVNGQPGPSAAPTHAPSVASPQAAIDAAGPGARPNTQAMTPVPAPGQPGGAMGPANPPGWTGPATAGPETAIAAADDAKGWRKALSKAMAGFKMPSMAKNDTALGGMASPGAARVDTPEIAPFDQNQLANQRQQLAMAMQRLNSGKLWI